MAKKQIKQYAFTPGAAGVGKVVITGNWPLNRILLITNVTRGVILFNFADSANSGATVSFLPGGTAQSTGDTSIVTYGVDPLTGNPGTAVIQNAIAGIGETTITFTNISTVGYSSSDSISIFVEDTYQYVRPWGDFGTDAIERTRVATPTSLIDADFEYGLQTTKWQAIELVNNYPSTYELPGPDFPVFSITTDAATPYSNISVNTYPTLHGFNNNDPFTIQQLDYNVPGYSRAQGASIVYANTKPTGGIGYNFSYYAKGQVGATPGQSLLTPRTLLRDCNFYTGANIAITSIASDGANPSLITVTTASQHGFTPGIPVTVVADAISGSGVVALTYLPGAYFANGITSSTTFNFYARGTVTSGTYTPNFGTNKLQLYTRSDAFFIHMPGTGGVNVGTNSPSHGATAQRQSKKYFRYQSGKGYFFNTGILFAPTYAITSIQSESPSQYSAGYTMKISTEIPHGLQANAVVKIAGVAPVSYNGTYTVNAVIDDLTVNVVIGSSGLSQNTGNIAYSPRLYLSNWSGSCIRTGPHDDANGMFWEYDGRYFNVVKRTSTTQLAGTTTYTPNSTTITGVNTKFTQQLKIGDRIVAKGMVHKVTYITSDTSISVAPFFRGVSASSGNFMYKVVEQRATQLNFNMDTVDGTSSHLNPSGYKMDPNFMQMVAVQYTWYGAGAMDFMVRGHDANFIMVHRMKQNNVNTTSSMRTGNMPIRYEVVNEAGSGVVTLQNNILTGSVTDPITVSDISYLPTSGYVYIDYEVIRYTGVSASTPWPSLTGITRSAPLSQYVLGGTKNFYGAPATGHTAGAGVELISLTASPDLGHWGSAFIVDGGFDSDRGYTFTYTANSVTVTSNLTAVFGIRLAPSVSNGIIGDLGIRDLLNRAQLGLSAIEISGPSGASSPTLANLQIRTELILNPLNYYNNENWATLNSSTYGNQPSLAQVSVSPVVTGGLDALNNQVGVSGPGQRAIAGEKLYEFVTPLSGGKGTQDLSMIKELTQSAVGGRGTFPNGSDTVYVNMVLLPSTAGLTLGNVSVTLRWAEAQA